MALLRKKYFIKTQWLIGFLLLFFFFLGCRFGNWRSIPEEGMNYHLSKPTVHRFTLSPDLFIKSSLSPIAEEDVKNTANKRAYLNARLFAILVVLSFLINVPFFIRWAKKQTGSNEVLFYNVEGKFTYFAVLLWIDQLEQLYKVPLIKERKEIEKLYNVAQKGGQSIKIFKRKIHDILLIKAFGNDMVRTAFQRMEWYSKLVFVWDWMIYLSIIYASICYFSLDTSWFMAVIGGGLAGNVVAAPTWLICHLIFNQNLKKASRQAIKNGNGVGMRIIMAQFYGAFGGVFWKDLYYIQGRSSWTIAGFGQGGSYGQGHSEAGYSTGWTHKQSQKDLEFDEKEE